MNWVLLVLWSAFAGGTSVSAVPPELALWTNPAALGGFQGFVLRANPIDRTGWIASSIGPLAYGVNQDRQLLLGVGGPIKGPLRLGVSVQPGTHPQVTLGTLFRIRFLSLGARVEVHRDQWAQAAVGLALRPGTDRLTLYADLQGQDLQGGFSRRNWRWSTGLFLQPVPGIHLATGVQATVEGQDLRVFAGIDLAMSRVRLGIAHQSPSETQVAVAVSQRLYPSWIPQRRFLVLRLQEPISEDPQRSWFRRKPSFTELLFALHQAAQDPQVQGVLLQVENPNALTWNQIEELHHALDSLRQRGKPVAAYLETLTLKGWFLASHADHILMPPTGLVMLVDLGTEKVYLKGALEKLDIDVQAPHIGKYKSAVEPLIRDRMSEADREQTRALLEDFAQVVRQALRQKVSLTSTQLDSLLYVGLLGDAEQALTLGLIDTIVPRHRLQKTLQDLWHVRRKVSLQTYATEIWNRQEFRWEGPKARVAVVSLEGSIVTGRSGISPWPIIGGKYIGSSSVVSLLQKLADDPRVKAVVLRVNSPGGSALASDIIWQAVQDLRRKKPVVVSMGYLAASGGYYISCGADEIFADRTTITGSIGILATKLAFGRLFQRWGLSRDTVLLSPHADGWSLWRPMTPEELTVLENYLERAYGVFLRRVSAGRGIPVARVDSLGQGRVWSGLRAKPIGLVDSLGGVVSALRAAAQRAGLKPGEYEVTVYTTQPPAQGLFSLLRTEVWQAPLRLWTQEPYLYHLGLWALP